MKSKIITALLSVISFVTAFTIMFSLPSKSANDYKFPNELSIDGAFADTVAPAPELFIVRAEGGALNVYDLDSIIIMTADIPLGLPYEDLDALSRGVMLAGREEVLKFMEDFAE